MDTETLYKNLITEFELGALSEEEKEATLLEIAKTIQKQFLLDVLDLLGEEKFQALEASLSMGQEFYETSLKHLLPNYEEVFKASRAKIVQSFKATHPA